MTLLSSGTVLLQQLLFVSYLFTDLFSLWTFYCHVPPCLFLLTSLTSLFLLSAVTFGLETALQLHAAVASVSVYRRV